MKKNLTYYRLPQKSISFHLVAEHHILWLKKSGFNVEVRELLFNREILEKLPQNNNTAIIHPLFYYSNWKNISFEEIVDILSSKHDRLIGMEVADSTAISSRFVSWANNKKISKIIVPSSFSKKSFLDSGVTNSVSVVPHGITKVVPSTLFDFLKSERHPKILTFVVGEPYRKGWDLVEKLIVQNPDLLFVVKGPSNPQSKQPYVRQENILLIEQWLSAENLASLYTNCDVLVSLHRGGAFELNCLEAASYGLPVISTKAGCVLDYLNDQNSLLVPVESETRLNPEGNDHAGLGYSASIKEALSILDYAIKNLDDLKRKSLLASDQLCNLYSWEKATFKLIDEISS